MGSSVSRQDVASRNFIENALIKELGQIGKVWFAVEGHVSAHKWFDASTAVLIMFPGKPVVRMIVSKAGPRRVMGIDGYSARINLDDIERMLLEIGSIKLAVMFPSQMARRDIALLLLEVSGVVFGMSTIAPLRKAL